MENLKPLLPCFEKALDTYNEIWNRTAEKYARLDQDFRQPMTYGPALMNLLKEPLIHIKEAVRLDGGGKLVCPLNLWREECRP